MNIYSQCVAHTHTRTYERIHSFDAYIYFRAYIHLRFKHAVLDTQLSCQDSLVQ